MLQKFPKLPNNDRTPKITFFAGTGFRELCQIPRNLQKLIAVKINTSKVANSKNQKI